ncbi:MAG: dUTP diphosphatase [Bacteroidetes bacterium]|nr:MAG: dUTP diphosphatase [Bacteroidota bacterium]
MLAINIVNRSNNELPHYQTDGSAGMDLKAFLEQEIILKPMQRFLVPTGLFVEIPKGYEGQVRPRSGLALKHGITVLNAPGTIDSDFRGEMKVLLINFSDQDFVIKNGERIAQLIIASYQQISWENVEVLSETLRGTGGYGSTGK